MVLSSRDMLGRYRILRLLGRGGMGEVYLAEDTRLGREVAVKVLRPGLASSPERRARFEREARASARLGHPGIVAIHSIEEADDQVFITMEPVDGEPLSERIPAKGLPVRTLLDFGCQLAEALSAAHEAGVLHRDLKPGNVMVDGDGRIKVLDFGLARAIEASDEQTGAPGSTHSARDTPEGAIQGTLAYMAPEQAQGQAVDERSDIFSLGVMLYEMASGERPFQGDSAASLLASVLRDEPASLSVTAPRVPRPLARIVRRCLEKAPGQRYRSAADLRIVLDDVREALASGELPGVEPAQSARPGRRRRLALVALAAVAATVLGVLFLSRPDFLSGRTEEPPLPAWTQRLTKDPALELFPSLSRDGKTLVYASLADGDWDIYRQRVGGDRPINLTPDHAGTDTTPALSPDGELIVFRSDREGGGLFLMGATGESVRRLTDLGHNPAWSPDGREVAFSSHHVVDWALLPPSSSLWVADARTGQTRKLAEGGAVQPAWSPNGRRIAYWGGPAPTNVAEDAFSFDKDVWTVAAEGGEPLKVTDDPANDWNPVWSGDGRHLFFSSDRGRTMSIWRVPVDEASGRVQGPAQPVTTAADSIHYHMALSDRGRRLVHVVARERYRIERVPFDAVTALVTGEPTLITTGGDEDVRDVSPDGRWITYDHGTPQDIYIARADGTSVRRLTTDPHLDAAARFSPDGSLLAFVTDRRGLREVWTIRPDGSGLRPLAPGALCVWSPEGDRIVARDVLKGGAHIIELERPSEPKALPLTSDARGFAPSSWSPDGKRIAGAARRHADVRASLFVLNLDTGDTVRVAESGRGAQWLSDGRRLIYVDDGILRVKDTVTGDGHEVLRLERPDSVYHLALSPDEQSLFFTRYRWDADIWMLSFEQDR